ncbi:sodium/glutamate symporter [Endozoicomonas sp. G2_1]|uniref:sodium/glutamate symporter n=1 Tax=Endozoicomonas sp. G2_1 TaxID=2821091 RepID=UPI001ADA77AC|nr:sodium/glutamate symporter [Endozoicomonas sp. G2_1]MBO9491643.1 sodium/glutamate symporter [Endozoicomonas sp. G2_1]
MELDGRQTILMALLVLFIGRKINNKIAFLRNYNIPEPVTGGVLASLLFSLIYFSNGLSLQFQLDIRDELLLVFFTTIGLSASFNSLKQGGKPLAILLVLAVVYLFVQNLTGITVAVLTGMPAPLGLVGGSVSLSGGHGTAIAWAPTFIEDYQLANAMTVGLACATFGLVLGGVVGGPIAEWLIKRHDLTPNHVDTPKLAISYQEETISEITPQNMFRSIFIIGACIGIGVHLNYLFSYLGVKLPAFVTCLFAGIIVTNAMPTLFKNIRWQRSEASLRLISEMSLGLFLAMSLMSLQLWTLIDLAGPILLILLAQLVIVTLFTVFVVFRAMGKTYDAATMSAGYAGLALGATPTAIANMTAVTKKFGAAPTAFIVVPLVGAFFIDISNAVIIKMLLSWVG